jgi:hypothetical protein
LLKRKQRWKGVNASMIIWWRSFIAVADENQSDWFGGDLRDVTPAPRRLPAPPTTPQPAGEQALILASDPQPP